MTLPEWGRPMTEQQVNDLGPAMADYLSGFGKFFYDHRSRAHLRTYCRGLLTDLPRKSVEPIALAAGTAVRSLQAFLTACQWDHAEVIAEARRRATLGLHTLPGGVTGTVGLVDETSALKKGEHTPGVQRQYLGCAGKTDNGIVTVHLGVARARYKALIDAELYLPKSWDDDRERCQAAGIPDEVVYRPKWQVALGQVRRAAAAGVAFDWLTFDEGYTSKPGLLAGLEADGQKYVGEAAVSLPCEGGRADEVAAASAAFASQKWRSVRVPKQTTKDASWRVKAARVRLWRDGGPTAGEYWLIVARSFRTGEVKYFVSNAPAEAGVPRLVRVAFTRWNVEHLFRVAKSEVGLTHYEGRKYDGLMRHMALCLVVMGFVSLHTQRLRGEKPGGDYGAGVPGAQRPLRRAAGPQARNPFDQAHVDAHPLSPDQEREGDTLTQTARTGCLKRPQHAL